MQTAWHFFNNTEISTRTGYSLSLLPYRLCSVPHKGLHLPGHTHPSVCPWVASSPQDTL